MARAFRMGRVDLQVDVVLGYALSSAWFPALSNCR